MIYSTSITKILCLRSMARSKMEMRESKFAAQPHLITHPIRFQRRALIWSLLVVVLMVMSIKLQISKLAKFTPLKKFLKDTCKERRRCSRCSAKEIYLTSSMTANRS